MKKIKVWQIVVSGIPIVVMLLGFWAGMFKTLRLGYVLAGAAGLAGLIMLILRFIRKMARYGKITQKLPAKATVVRSQMANLILVTGGIDKTYVCTIEMDVCNPNGETWPAILVTHLTEAEIARFQPGYNFNVYYDAHNRKKVMRDTAVSMN